MSDVKELLKGGYDLHVHSAPDCLPRKMDDIDMAERITASTLSGYAIKNHWTSTAGRAKLINALYEVSFFLYTMRCPPGRQDGHGAPRPAGGASRHRM